MIRPRLKSKATASVVCLLATALLTLHLNQGSARGAIVQVGGSGQFAPSGQFMSFIPHIDPEQGLVLDIVPPGIDPVFGLGVMSTIGVDTNLEAFSFPNIYGGVQDLFSFGGRTFLPAVTAPQVDLSQQTTWTPFVPVEMVSVGEKYVFGWRYIPDGSPDYYYGWSMLQIGSILHTQSFANNALGGSIILGEGAPAVPEPATFVTLGLAGLFMYRRRRIRG